MTIIEAVKTVLNSVTEGLTTKEIYDEIIRRNLYEFRAKKPADVVNCEIRRHCQGLAFPTAHPVKYFKIIKSGKQKSKYTLVNVDFTTEHNEKENFVNMLPEEKIQQAYDEHIQSLSQQILEAILNKSFDFFEQLVVELLLKMDYGYDEKSGIVTGGSRDGGIDGIINEDKFGLSLIYLQAKRYDALYKVKAKDVQAFVGAMQNISKGVFITTSSYTKDAIAYANKQQQKNLKLVDGKLLAELLIKYEVGVSSVKKMDVYKIDNDYFI